METVTFKSPLKYETVQTFLGEGLLGALQSIVAILALVFLLIGALLYITSGGSDGQVKVAKGAITAALIGFAIALAAPTFLKEIATILGWGPGDPNVADVSGALSLGEILMKVLNFLLGIFGIVAIIMLLIGGLSYLSSAGDEDRIDSSKEIVKAALIGTVIAFASLVIIKQIASLFGVGR